MDEDEGDETYVRPTELTSVPDGNVFHVACDMTTAAGTYLKGYWQIYNGQFHYPVLFVATGPDNPWTLDEPPRRKDRARFEAFFGVEYSKLFPIKWKLAVPIDGESELRSGIYSGAESGW